MSTLGAPNPKHTKIRMFGDKVYILMTNFIKRNQNDETPPSYISIVHEGIEGRRNHYRYRLTSVSVNSAYHY